MIFVAPGQPFEATTSGAPTGLTGTIGVRIMDGVGGEALARTAAGIIETPAGSGVYVATLTAPTLAGSYVILWDQGVVSPETTAADDLVVTSTTPGGALPNTGDLTTVAAVRAVLQKTSGETAQNDVIQQFITRASGLIMLETGREFTPRTDAQARAFVYRGTEMIDLAPYDLRATSSVVLRLSGTDTTLVADDDYSLRPLPARDGVYRWIQLRPSRRPYGRRYWAWHDPLSAPEDEGVVTVTGDWGFPAIPPEVEHFCVMTVVIWLRRDVSAFSATYNLDEARLERPEALPAAVRAGLRKWRHPVIG